MGVRMSVCLRINKTVPGRRNFRISERPPLNTPDSMSTQATGMDGPHVKQKHFSSPPPPPSLSPFWSVSPSASLAISVFPQHVQYTERQEYRTTCVSWDFFAL